jgi:hypothetical protein
VFGRPSRAAILRFRRLAVAHGATGVSWWVWQHARPVEWSALSAPLVVPQRASQAPVATLRPGATGDPVRWLQLKLREAGEPVPLTARFDAATSAALVRFKVASLLSPVPVADPATWSALLSAPTDGRLVELEELPPISAEPAASPPPSTSR